MAWFVLRSKSSTSPDSTETKVSFTAVANPVLAFSSKMSEPLSLIEDTKPSMARSVSFKDGASVSDSVALMPF